jgi:hypothetical protein
MEDYIYIKRETKTDTRVDAALSAALHKTDLNEVHV